MPPRSRTGCLTCRQRKLKCSEERPVCAQCVKANRECVPSTGITFRHQQNPSMNATPAAEGSLKNFYGYKETFAKETTWVQVPRELKFVHTNNPYEDDLDGGYADGDTSFMTDMSEAYGDGHVRDHYEQELERALTQAAYPQYATQGLEALSAVASQDQYSYAHAPPPAPMTQPEHSPQQHFSTAHPQQGHSTASQNLDFILNPTSAGAAMSHSNNSNIDPRLHSEHPMPPREDSGQSHPQVPEHDRTTATLAQELLRAQN